MWSGEGSRARRAVQALLRLHDGPERTAAAFALGVFFSFSPFLGLQILLSMSLAFLFGLNRVAVFVGLNTNLPWFIAPWYAFTTVAAAAALGLASPASLGEDVRMFFASDWTVAVIWSQAKSLLEPLLVPFLLGPTIGAAVVAALAFLAARACLVRRASVRAAAHTG